MEKYKIYRRDNYIEIAPINGLYIFTGHVKEVKVVREVQKRNKFRFYGISKWNPLIYLNLTQILDENGNNYSLNDWEDFYNQNTGNFSDGGGVVPFDPSLYDLSEFQNGSLDRFIQESDLLAYSAVTSVANYSALPDPTTVPGEMYIAENEQGTAWLPGSLGGTYYPEGMYYSNGVKWIYQKSAYQATQMEVDAGLNTDKFVTPNTLEGIKPITQGADTVDDVRKVSAMTKAEYDSIGTPDVKTIYFLEEYTDSKYKIVNDVSDFPTSISGVITLEADTTYVIANTIDLNGLRLQGSANTTIIGGSSETAFLTSTGLSSSTALISSMYTTPMRHITIRDIDKAVDFDGSMNPNPMALDWTGVNFVNIPNIGTIKMSSNFIFDKGSFINAKGLKFDGTIGTIGLANSLFSGDGGAGSCLELLSTCTVSRRFRVLYSSVVAFGSTIGITVSASTTIPDEGYILDNINFSGGVTYLSGLDFTSNKALFRNCVGITNTFETGSLYAENQSTATAISSSGTYVKANVTTTAGEVLGRFTHSNNRLTYTGSKTRVFEVQCTLALTSGSDGDNIAIKIYKNGVAVNGTRGVGTTRSIFLTNKAENIPTQAILSLNTNDYIEIWIANLSDTSSVTVTDINLIVK